MSEWVHYLGLAKCGGPGVGRTRAGPPGLAARILVLSGSRNKTEFIYLRKWAHCDMSAGQSQGEGLGRRHPEAEGTCAERARADGAGYWSVVWCTEDVVNEDTSLALVWWQTYLQLTPYVGHQSTKLVFHGGYWSTQ